MTATDLWHYPPRKVRAQPENRPHTIRLVTASPFHREITHLRNAPSQPAIIFTAASTTRSTEGTYSRSSAGGAGVGVSGAATRMMGASK